MEDIIKVGEKAPDFTLKDQSGADVALSDFHGKKVLLINNVRILADFHPLGKVAKAYGVFSEEYGASKRANILIDEKGNVSWVKKYEIRMLPDVEEVIAQL